jgi:hypothetical protein
LDVCFGSKGDGELETIDATAAKAFAAKAQATQKRPVVTRSALVAEGLSYWRGIS